METSISKGQDHLEQIDVMTKTNIIEWARPTVYVTNKNNEIRAYVDISTGVNNCFETYNCPLPSSEDNFATLRGSKVFSKQISVHEECAKYLTVCKQRSL